MRAFLRAFTVAAAVLWAGPGIAQSRDLAIKLRASEAPGAASAVGVYPALGQSFKDCPECPKMVAVPAGSFTMGSEEAETKREGWPDEYAKWERPRHPVAIPRPFAVGKFEVTFEEWDACVAAGGCNGYRPRDQGWGRGKRPVINVSWDHAKAYAAWLSRRTGKPYRLLTEAEWEYAARAGTTTAWFWGDEIGSGNANCGSGCGDSYPNTAPVGSFRANSFGLHDTLGNVWEWVEDCWNESYSGAPADGRAWTSGDCSRRVLRGGSWIDLPRFVRSAYRSKFTSDEYGRGRFGFRVARTLD